VIGQTAGGAPVYHPGCVVVKDVGSAIKGRHIDFFTGLCKHYNTHNNTCRDSGNEALVAGLTGSKYFVLPRDLARAAVGERAQNFDLAYHHHDFGEETDTAEQKIER
jgi:hypothetical protein